MATPPSVSDLKDAVKRLFWFSGFLVSICFVLFCFCVVSFIIVFLDFLVYYVFFGGGGGGEGFRLFFWVFWGDKLLAFKGLGVFRLLSYFWVVKGFSWFSLGGLRVV